MAGVGQVLQLPAARPAELEQQAGLALAGQLAAHFVDGLVADQATALSAHPNGKWDRSAVFETMIVSSFCEKYGCRATFW